MDNALLIGGALGALLLAGAGMAFMRRKKNAAPEAEQSVLGEASLQANSLFAETGGQSVDTNNSVFNSNFAPSASQLDTNEVDPVAEADVYIAYGRDAQAEEILKEALRTHPERHAVRLKLLEIYAARKDARAFETQAGELYSMTKGQGDEWAQAAAIGISVDPTNPLYASAAGNSTVIPSKPSAAAEQALLAEQLEQSFVADTPASGLMDLDLDLSNDTPAPKAEAPVQAENSVLDFDLGGLTFEPVGADAPAAPAAKPSLAKKEEPLDMGFANSVWAGSPPISAPKSVILCNSSL